MESESIELIFQEDLDESIRSNNAALDSQDIILYLREQEQIKKWFCDNLLWTVLRVIKRHDETNARFRAMSFYDILACIRFDSVGSHNGVVPRKEMMDIGDATIMEGICNRSSLTDIDLNLIDVDTPYHHHISGENQVNDTLFDDGRKYGSVWKDTVVRYNNPFDPRLAFDGLHFTEKQKHNPCNTEYTNESLDKLNSFLDIRNPTGFFNIYFASYRQYFGDLHDDNKKQAKVDLLDFPKHPKQDVVTASHEIMSNSKELYVGNSTAFVSKECESTDMWSQITATKRFWLHNNDYESAEEKPTQSLLCAVFSRSAEEQEGQTSNIRTCDDETNTNSIRYMNIQVDSCQQTSNSVQQLSDKGVTDDEGESSVVDRKTICTEQKESKYQNHSPSFSLCDDGGDLSTDKDIAKDATVTHTFAKQSPVSSCPTSRSEHSEKPHPTITILRHKQQHPKDDQHKQHKQLRLSLQPNEEFHQDCEIRNDNKHKKRPYENKHQLQEQQTIQQQQGAQTFKKDEQRMKERNLTHLNLPQTQHKERQDQEQHMLQHMQAQQPQIHRKIPTQQVQSSQQQIRQNQLHQQQLSSRQIQQPQYQQRLIQHTQQQQYLKEQQRHVLLKERQHQEKQEVMRLQIMKQQNYRQQQQNTLQQQQQQQQYYHQSQQHQQQFRQQNIVPHNQPEMQKCDQFHYTQGQGQRIGLQQDYRQNHAQDPSSLQYLNQPFLIHDHVPHVTNRQLQENSREPMYHVHYLNRQTQYVDSTFVGNGQRAKNVNIGQQATYQSGYNWQNIDEYSSGQNIYTNNEYVNVYQTSGITGGAKNLNPNLQSQDLKFDDEVWYINGIPHRHAKHVQLNTSLDVDCAPDITLVSNSYNCNAEPSDQYILSSRNIQQNLEETSKGNAHPIVSMEATVHMEKHPGRLNLDPGNQNNSSVVNVGLYGYDITDNSTASRSDSMAYSDSPTSNTSHEFTNSSISINECLEMSNSSDWFTQANSPHAAYLEECDGQHTDLFLDGETFENVPLPSELHHYGYQHDYRDLEKYTHAVDNCSLYKDTSENETVGRHIQVLDGRVRVLSERVKKERIKTQRNQSIPRMSNLIKII